MGKDIHGWVEKNINGKWVAIDRIIDRKRNIQRFHALSKGVIPKGIPEDISDTVNFWIEKDKDIYHSHNYIPALSFAAICMHTDEHSIKTKEDAEYFTNNMLEYHVCSIFNREPFSWETEGFDMDTINDYRVVYWFEG